MSRWGTSEGFFLFPFYGQKSYTTTQTRSIPPTPNPWCGEDKVNIEPNVLHHRAR